MDGAEKDKPEGFEGKQGKDDMDGEEIKDLGDIDDLRTCIKKRLMTRNCSSRCLHCLK